MTLTHSSPVLHFMQKKITGFAVQIKWLVFILIAILDWNGSIPSILVFLLKIHGRVEFLIELRVRTDKRIWDCYQDSTHDKLREKCPYSELFWSEFSRIRTEYGEILCTSPYSVWIWEIRTRTTLTTDTFKQWYLPTFE